MAGFRDEEDGLRVDEGRKESLFWKLVSAAYTLQKSQFPWLPIGQPASRRLPGLPVWLRATHRSANTAPGAGHRMVI